MAKSSRRKQSRSPAKKEQSIPPPEPVDGNASVINRKRKEGPDTKDEDHKRQKIASQASKANKVEGSAKLATIGQPDDKHSETSEKDVAYATPKHAKGVAPMQSIPSANTVAEHEHSSPLKTGSRARGEVQGLEATTEPPEPAMPEGSTDPDTWTKVPGRSATDQLTSLIPKLFKTGNDKNEVAAWVAKGKPLYAPTRKVNPWSKAGASRKETAIEYLVRMEGMSEDSAKNLVKEAEAELRVAYLSKPSTESALPESLSSIRLPSEGPDANVTPLPFPTGEDGSPVPDTIASRTAARRRGELSESPGKTATKSSRKATDSKHAASSTKVENPAAVGDEAEAIVPSKYTDPDVANRFPIEWTTVDYLASEDSKTEMLIPMDQLNGPERMRRREKIARREEKTAREKAAREGREYNPLEEEKEWDWKEHVHEYDGDDVDD